MKSYQDVGKISPHWQNLSPCRLQLDPQNFQCSSNGSTVTSLDGRDANDKIGRQEEVSDPCAKTAGCPFKNLSPGSFGMASTSGYRNGARFFRFGEIDLRSREHICEILPIISTGPM
jgi:hypothetical protein